MKHIPKFILLLCIASSLVYADTYGSCSFSSNSPLGITGSLQITYNNKWVVGYNINNIPAGATYRLVIRSTGDISTTTSSGESGFSFDNCPKGLLGSVTKANSQGVWDGLTVSNDYSLTSAQSIIGRSISIIDSSTTKCKASAKVHAQCVIGIGNPTTFSIAGQLAPVDNSAYLQVTSLSKAVCVLQPTNVVENNQVGGFVHVTVYNNGTTVFAASVTGLDTTVAHGIHIHNYGDIQWMNGSSIGGHWKTANQVHALPPAANREYGDLGNICVYKNGVGYYLWSTKDLPNFNNNPNLIGRAIAIHAIRDSGDSSPLGPPIAQCVL
ncbi:hypothetical protein SAMD00019534_090870, partial [Acytostelium subglobosum LB1]|uniref:hypothetical protein n=1 Tax=Acytostelium subglobosum LB1 TaxID=1410327 RepID=UPI000644ACF5